MNPANVTGEGKSSCDCKKARTVWVAVGSTLAEQAWHWEQSWHPIPPPRQA